MTIATTVKVAPRRIAVDFDNTIAHTTYPTIHGVKPGARAALTVFRELGFQIVIWSCRTCHWDYEVYGGNREEPTLERDRVLEMIAFLDAEGIPYDEVDDGSKGKPNAEFFIDDKGVRFMDNWEEIARGVFEMCALERMGKGEDISVNYKIAPNGQVLIASGD